MDTLGSKTPRKNYRSHSDVEPDTPSPSITKQPKSSKISNDEYDYLVSRKQGETDLMEMIQQKVQISFRSIIREEIEKGNSDLLVKLNILTEKLNNQEKELDSCKEKLVKERQYVKILEEKILKLESYTRRDNLRFLGIPEEKGETAMGCERKVIQAIKTSGLGNIHPRAIVRAHRVGPPSYGTDSKSRPILVRFSHYKDKEYTLGNQNKLKQVGVKIMEDFPDEIDKQRQILIPIYWAIFNFTEDGYNFPYRNKVKLTAERLIWNGLVITTASLDKLPSQFRPEAVATPSKQAVTAFFTGASPLSNHYKCSIEIGKWKYNCVEQRYFHQKALTLGDEETAQKILMTENAKYQKKLGYMIKDHGQKKNVWDSR